ncbi:type IV secretory system conjugative DNA transfer family protein [Leifsonia sp. H3M29-4]|uniref:type IV secretory system conjugative DNA transfer family protein n=1 Tax=Salinibacterium metalliresistens TaxID=3031321 RepID=UPI0023DB7E76|nr:type IV secretory system conjugative DNA transfer family protein [Salinibacterium metalliresistens]MDF1478771.1 type IV secretory system conjugative DNA transfer family protein [Salinibacterium metalliresistens]
MPDSYVFTRLYLPRPIDASTVTVLLTRLAGSDVPRPIAFEMAASADGVVAAFGCAPMAVHRLKRLLGGLVPGLGFGPAVRPHVAAVSRVTARPGGLPLAEVDPEQVVGGVYQALAARRGEEVVGVQLILGRAHRPQQLTATPLDPLQPLGSMLIDGVRPAPTDTKRRLHAHAGQARFDVTLRIGVTAETVKRRHGLLWEVFGALQPLESPGVRLSLVHDTAPRWKAGQSGGGGRLRLTASEIVPLLAWPLGERQYAGVPPLHPRLLPVPEIVSRTQAVFALGTAPGPDRPIGLDPQSRLQHLVAIGPTGSGKSTLLEHLILSDIAAGRACCVIEPKKQLVDRILATAPTDAAGRIVVLDATDKDAPIGFNPLDVGDRDPDIVVDGILSALGAVFHEGWGPRTEYLVQGALLSLARAGQKRTEPFTLIDLPRLLSDAAFRRPVVAAVQDDATLAAFWADFEAMSPGQRAAAIASPLNKLRKIVMRQPLVRVLGQSQPRFRLRDVFREKKTVLVPLNDALIGEGASKLLGSLIVAELFLAATERAAEKEPMKRPGMIFIDEVQNYLHLPTSVENAMSVFRSYGVGVHVAHQYRKQLPDGLRSGLDANARSKLCFALDTEDAQAMAKRAPSLTADDFETLPKHHVYARLMAGASPTEWCSAAILPPTPESGAADLIREASRQRYGALPPIQPAELSMPKGVTSDPEPRRSHQKVRAT